MVESKETTTTETQPEYVSKAEAAILLQVSEKTIERMAARKRICVSKRPRPGMKAEVVYAMADLSRLKSEKEVAAVQVISPDQHPKLNKRVENTVFVSTSQRLPRMPEINVVAEIGIKDKIYLTLEETVLFSGLPSAYLRELIHAGTLKAIKRDKYYIKRRDIEAL